VTGYRVYYGNHCLQIPLVHVLTDPAAYPNDPFAATLPRYGSVLWRIVAAAGRFIPLEPLLLAGFVLERFLVIVAGGLLARTMIPGSRLAVTGVMSIFALAPTPLLGDGTLVAPYFEQTGLAVVFLLLATGALYARRPVPWAILSAIGFECNSLYGVYFCAYFGLTLAFDRAYHREWRRWLLASVLALVLGSPEIIAGLRTIGQHAADERLWLAASRIRFPQHLAPLSWHGLPFIKYAALALGTLVVLYRHRCRDARLFLHGAIWTAVSLGWLLFAFLAAYVINEPWALVLHPARGTDPWYGLAAAALTATCARSLEEENAGRHRWRVILFFGSILFWLPTPRFAAALLAVVLLLEWRSTWERALLQGDPRRVGLAVVLLVVVLAAIALPARGGVFTGPPRDQADLAGWASRHTRADATFLVNPTWEAFRALARRSVYVTWKDGSAILWDQAFVHPWSERLGAIGVDVRDPGLRNKDVCDAAYRRLRDDQVRILAQQYHVAYWVVPAAQASVFPAVCQRSGYKVLEVGG
jgi:hypothetical protein